MAKTKISEWSSTPGSNTDIDGINLAEGMLPSDVNNAMREMMSQIKDLQSANVTYYTADSDAIAVGAGGTGAITAASARTNLGVPSLSGNNTLAGVQTLSGLTASSAVATNASKELVSVTNTGSGNNVLATSPTITGATLTTAALNGTLGATTPSTVVATTITGTDLTTTGNTILGNASTDTLNVGNGDLIKDASGNVGIGATPSAWSTLFPALQIGTGGSFLSAQGSTPAVYVGANAYYNAGWKYSTTNFATYYAQSGTSGTHIWHTAPLGTAGNAITFTQAMTLDASGGLKTLNTIGVGNATPSTSGAGITFPATQSASTDANTLDDYEEGTWTPIAVFSGGNGTLTYDHQAGSYTKVGRLVTLNCRFGIIKGTAAGNFVIGGLPFTVANGQAYYGGASIGGLIRIGKAGNVVQIRQVLNTTTADVYLTPLDSLNQSVPLTVADIDAGATAGPSSLFFSLVYFTS